MACRGFIVTTASNRGAVVFYSLIKINKMKREKIIVDISLTDNLVVRFDCLITPEEPMVMYYKDGSGHPGSPAEIYILNMEILQGNISDYTEYIENFYFRQIEKETKRFYFKDIWMHFEDLIFKQIDN